MNLTQVSTMHPMCSVDSCATLMCAGLDRNRSSICASVGPWENHGKSSSLAVEPRLPTFWEPDMAGQCGQFGWIFPISPNLPKSTYIYIYMYFVFIVLYYIIFYYNILYYIILYYIILYIFATVSIFSQFFHMFPVAPISSSGHASLAEGGRFITFEGRA